MSILGNVAFVVCVILAVIDFLTDQDLLNFWLILLLIFQFTMGYRYYFEEGRKIQGIIIMGAISATFIFIAITLVT